jgi:hypothetical protein
MKVIIIGFLFAIGYVLGEIFIEWLLKKTVRMFNKSKLGKAIAENTIKKNERETPYRRYHDTRMGFKP